MQKVCGFNGVVFMLNDIGMIPIYFVFKFGMGSNDNVVFRRRHSSGSSSCLCHSVTTLAFEGELRGIHGITAFHGIVQGLVNVPTIGDVFHITKPNICWRLYSQ